MLAGWATSFFCAEQGSRVRGMRSLSAAAVQNSGVPCTGRASSLHGRALGIHGAIIPLRAPIVSVLGVHDPHMDRPWQASPMRLHAQP